jgi:hypothetical protein
VGGGVNIRLACCLSVLASVVVGHGRDLSSVETPIASARVYVSTMVDENLESSAPFRSPVMTRWSTPLFAVLRAPCWSIWPSVAVPSVLPRANDLDEAAPGLAAWRWLSAKVSRLSLVAQRDCHLGPRRTAWSRQEYSKHLDGLPRRLYSEKRTGGGGLRLLTAFVDCRCGRLTSILSHNLWQGGTPCR